MKPPALGPGGPVASPAPREATAVHVVYDHQMFALQAYGGISRLFTELMRRLTREPGCAVSWFRGHHVDEYDASSWIARLRRYRASDGGAALDESSRAEQNWTGLRAFLDEAGPGRSLYHPTYYDGRSLDLAGSRPLVVTVADLIAERFLAGQERFARHLDDRRRLFARADLLLAISERTRRDLAEIHGVPDQRIRVCPLGSDLGAVEPAALEPRSRPFFLYVGTRSKYKNFDLLLRAYAAAEDLRRDFDVIVFGGSSALLPHELEFLRRHGLEDRFLYRRGDDRLLRALYGRAVGLVHTSRYEGFGLAPLEAMQCGCPVVCCPVGALPEVVGSAAAFVDPDDPAGLAEAMRRVAGDSASRAAMIAAGRRQAERFSWRRTAQATLAAYREVA